MRNPLKPHALWLPVRGTLAIPPAGHRRFDGGRFLMVIERELRDARAAVQRYGDRLHFHGAHAPRHSLRSVAYDGMIEIKRTAAGPTTLAYGVSFGPHILFVMAAMGGAGYSLWEGGYTVLSCAVGGALTLIVFHLALSGMVFCLSRYRLGSWLRASVE